MENTLTNKTFSGSPPAQRDVGNGKEGGVAALGAVASFGAVFAAAACCVLPAALAAVGVGAGLSSSFSALVPFHWPLTIAAVAAIVLGWVFYARRRKLCASDTTCTRTPPTRATFVMLCFATASVALSSIWPFIEGPLMQSIGQA